MSSKFDRRLFGYGKFTVEEVMKAIQELNNAMPSVYDFLPRYPWNEKPEMLQADPEWKPKREAD